MKTFLVVCVLMIASACQTASDITKSAFSYDYYEPPALYTKTETPKTETPKKGDSDKGSQTGGTSSGQAISNNGNIVVYDNEGRPKLNSANLDVARFVNAIKFDDIDLFHAIAYSHISVADSRCRIRNGELKRALSATSSGFDMLTSITAITGSSLASGNAANAASGAAAFFNTLSSSSSSMESGIMSALSAQAIGGITVQRKQAYDDLVELLEATKPDSDVLQDSYSHQAKIRTMLLRYNAMCSITG